MTSIPVTSQLLSDIRQYGGACSIDVVLALVGEIERLQKIIDSRPAINAGLPGTYIQWSRGIYELDVRAALGRQAS